MSMVWRAVIVVVVGLAGAGAGMVAANGLGPTNAEVREGARSLVPPEAEVVGKQSGYRGNWPTKGPYFAAVDIKGGGDAVTRESALRRHAGQLGWEIMAMERFPNAVVLRLAKGDLVASGDVRLADDSGRIRVGKGDEERRRVRGSVVGGLVGAGLAVLGLALRGAAPGSLRRHP